MKKAGGMALLGALGFLGTAAQAEPAMMMQAANSPPPASTNAAAGSAPATNAIAAVPTPVPDTYGRYGKILAPGDEVAHPLKLKMPFPGVGEVKVPKKDELDMRQKLEELAKLSDDDIRKQLMEWPAFSRMNLHDEGVMLQRIQDFRTYRSSAAMQKAHQMGLLTLTPDQKARFEKDYWDKRLKLDQELAKQFQPVFQQREQKLEDELFREFSSNGPGPQVPPAPAPKGGPLSTTPPLAVAPGLTNAAPMAQAPR